MEKTKTKKNTKKKPDEEKDKSNKNSLILGPRITEKSAILAEKGVYTFNVAKLANKNEVKKAVKLVHGVEPLRVTVTQIAKKTVTRRGITSVKQGGKKAVVYLKKGDKITFA